MTTTTDALVLDRDAQRLLFTDAHSPLRGQEAHVSVEAVRRAYDLATFGPTANDGMPMRVTLAQSPASRQRVVEAAMESDKARLESAPMVIVTVADDGEHGLAERSGRPSWDDVARVM